MSKLVNVGEFSFQDDEIIGIEINTATDLVGDELSADVAEITVKYVKGLESISWETPVTIYSDGNFAGEYYFTSAKRTSLNLAVINATSLVGLMEYETYYGDYYNGTNFSDIFEDMVKSDGLNRFVALDSLEVKSTPLSPSRGVTFVYGSIDPTNPEEKASNFKTWGWVSNRSRMRVRFKYNGFGVTPSSIGKSWGSNIAGFHSSQISSNYWYYIRGRYTRASADEEWPQTTELFFGYGSQQYSIGTPTIGDVIEVDCIPAQGKVIINGVEHTLSVSETEYYVPIKVAGGGNYLVPFGSTGEYFVEPDTHHSDIVYYEYTLFDLNDNVIFNVQPCVYFKTNVVWAKDTVLKDARPIESGVVTNEITVPGYVKANYRQAILDRISYGDGISSIKIYGLLPILTKREALHQLLFATGIIIKKTVDGGILLDSPTNTSVSTIAEEDSFIGGSVEYLEEVNSISVQEFSYIDNTSSVANRKVIYENATESAESFVAIYDEPASTLHTSTAVYALPDKVIAYCANAALVANGAITIYGFPYTVQKRTAIRSIGNTVSGKDVSIGDVKLITLQNVDSVMDRMEAYYKSSYRCLFDFVKSIERCGYKYNFTSPFSEKVSGFAIQMSEVLSKIDKASCEFLVGYIAGKAGDGFQNFVVLSGSGSWTVPESVFSKSNPRIRVILIGGGTGGDSGYAGEPGKVNSSAGTIVKRAEGGNVGARGNGGYIYSHTIENPDDVYTYSCGIGGEGGEISYSHDTSNPGSSGTITTLNSNHISLTSDMGSPQELGVVNFFTGDRYGIPFPVNSNWNEYFLSIIFDGISQAQARYGGGGFGGTFRKEADKYYVYYACSCIVQSDLAVPNGIVAQAGLPETSSNSLGGAGGGGGCGLGGGNGKPGNADISTYKAKTGDGGDGGDATWIPPKATEYNETYYGCGGLGGGGGGGGGATGLYPTSQGWEITLGTPGKGGYGGRGGAGGDGCVIVYY